MVDVVVGVEVFAPGVLRPLRVAVLVVPAVLQDGLVERGGQLSVHGTCEWKCDSRNSSWGNDLRSKF